MLNKVKEFFKKKLAHKGNVEEVLGQPVYHIFYKKEFYFGEADTLEELQALAHKNIDNEFAESAVAEKQGYVSNMKFRATIKALAMETYKDVTILYLSKPKNK